MATDLERRFVTFCLGDEEFCIDIMTVQEIVRQPKISRIPIAPKYVEGIANLRGTLLPVLDARTRFGIERQQDTDSTRVIVLDIDGANVGLRVDRVLQVTRVGADELARPPAMIRAGMSAEYLEGLANLDDGRRVLFTLRPAAVCNLRQPEGASIEGSAGTQRHRMAPTARQEQPALSSDVSTKYVIFQSAQQEYAVPMASVREILRAQKPKAVPDMPDSFLGVLNVRGEVLPVLDLRLLLGMPKQATELADAIGRRAAGYERWLTELSQSTAAAVTGEGLTDAQALLAWVGAFNTSNELLLETLEGIRAANEPLLRLCSGTVGSSSNRDTGPLIGNEIRATGLEVLRLLSRLKEQIAEGVVEDQRLIVIEQANSLFALTVDRVREVRNLPQHVITASLRLGSADDSAKFRGVANLDEGKRLILLLEPRQLVNSEWLEIAKHALEGEVASDPDLLADGAHRPEADAAEGVSDALFVVFRLAEGDYGLPIQTVCEIGRYVRPTTVPTAAAHVEGVINLRGEVVPVVNVRRRLELAALAPDERTRLIFVQVNGKKTALVVDSVARVTHLSTNEIVSPPDATQLDIEQDCVAGVATRAADEPMIVLLDAAAFVESSPQVST